MRKMKNKKSLVALCVIVPLAAVLTAFAAKMHHKRTYTESF